MNYLPTNGTNPLPPNVTNPPNYPPPGEQSYLDSQPQPWPAEEPTEYARTLIGPLAAGAQTLNDNNDEPGVFFLFQDLSVRTEGVFRLRMRLVNVGGCVATFHRWLFPPLISRRPPAPDPGASYVRSDNSTVLAQVFTDPFTVFSPKKFPGVPCTANTFLCIKRIHCSQPQLYYLSVSFNRDSKFQGYVHQLLSSYEHRADRNNSALAFPMAKGQQTRGENDERQMPRNGCRATVLPATRTKNDKRPVNFFRTSALETATYGRSKFPNFY
jgi:Velvet factor